MKHRLLSVLLTVTVMASALAGAMAVSVLPVKADSETTGYVDDLFDRAKEDCPSAKHQILENIRTLYNTYFDNWLIVIMHDTNTSNWYFAAYEQNTNYTLSFWWYKDSYYTVFRPRVVGDNYMEQFHSCYGFKIFGTNFTELPTAIELGNTNFNGTDVFQSSTWRWNAPSPSDLNHAGREVYCNRDIKDRNYDTFYTANLLPGSYVPPISEYHWFKFQLGERWFITTTDQSYVNNMIVEDETHYVWKLQIMYEDETFDEWFIESSMMVRLSYAESFISQELQNVSPFGVYAYDITDWINDENYVNATSVFYQVFETPGGYNDWLYIAYSDDVVSFVLTPQEQQQTQNNAWTVINNYYENYPSVTIAPEQLASQLVGTSAISSGLGKVQIPEQLYIWMNNGVTLREVDSDFHYDLSVSGLDPDDSTLASMINYDILNVAIVASKKTVNDSLVIHPIKMCNWDYRYENDPNDNYTVDVDLLANISYEDLWEMYDLVFIVDPDSPWLLDPDDEFDLSHITSYFYRFGYTGSDVKRGNMAVHELASQYPAYWVLTRSALQKSQLYVFCDGFSKLYDLATQYCNKRDLWDSSFFEWSMSIFWELETVNGHLFALENEVLGWKLSTQFELLFDKLETLSNNIVDPDLSDVDPWYLPLWEWVNRFAPSVNDFSNSIDVMDDTFDELPAIPQVTDPPAIPTLPGFD